MLGAPIAAYQPNVVLNASPQMAAEQLPRCERIASAIAVASSSLDYLEGYIRILIGEHPTPCAPPQPNQPISLALLLDQAPEALFQIAKRMDTARELLQARLG